MEWYTAGALLIGPIILMLMIGVPVAIAFLIANIIGAIIFFGPKVGIIQIVDNSTDLITTFTLSPIPLFILLGSLFFHTGLALRVFDGLDKILGRIPGRLCYLTLASGTMFSSLVGSSMANTAMLGSLMVPEMRRRGYSLRMTMGPILGTGGLAMIIPPSNLGVLLASIANIDVGQLLIAGLIPGLVLAGLYGALIFAQITLNPSSAPSYSVEHVDFIEKVRTFIVDILPLGLVVFMVVGFIILGIATPTESAAFGVLGVVILAFLFRCLSWTAIVKAIDGAVSVTGMVFLILMNSVVFSQLLAFSGASGGFLKWATALSASPLTILLVMIFVLLILGMFMDEMSMMLITIPIFFPLSTSLGFDPTWFGIIVLMTLEMSATTPPFGLLLFIMLGMSPPGTSLWRVASWALPFLACDSILIGLLIAHPQIALYLPGLMQ